MQGYERDVCEDDGEASEYLLLRQRLKESIRKRMKTDQGTANSDKTNIAFRKDKYGSFFGPSHPVIAKRVIQESKSLLENLNVAARIAKSIHKNSNKTIRLKSQANHLPSVAKNKVEMLKYTRDYSFLLSEDAEIPASTKSPPVSAPKSNARSAQPLPRRKPVANDRGREPSNCRDVRKPMLSTSSARNTTSGDRKLTSSAVQYVARKPTTSNLQSGIHRPTPSHLKRPLARKEYHETSKPKIISKQALPPSRVQLKRSPPKIPSRAPSRPKAKPKRQLYEEDSDGDDAINMIRQMFGYDPNKFQDDDDDRDMEANFDDIMREERRSAKIARKEDEEQLRLIVEEERREKMQLAKKPKLSRCQ